MIPTKNSKYFDRQGNPISADLWTLENNRVAFAQIGDVEISTVYLGLDHKFGDGPPLIFETMIFGGSHDGDTWRYASEAEAKEGQKNAEKLVHNEEKANGSR